MRDETQKMAIVESKNQRSSDDPAAKSSPIRFARGPRWSLSPFLYQSVPEQTFFSKLSHRINWKKNKSCPPVFQLPPGLSFHIGSPFASPVGVPDPKRSHNALEPSVPHLLARSSSANVHCSGRSSQIFPPQQHGMTQLISSWNSANLWCFSIHFWQNTLIPCLQFTHPGKFNGPLLYTINWHSNAKSLSHSRMYIYI